jgi:BON domain
MRISSAPCVSARVRARRLIVFLLFGLLWGCNKKPNDQLLSQQVQDRFFQDPELRKFDIQVESANGVVTLTGIVDEENERASASRIAGQVPGVKQVVLSLTAAEAATQTEESNPAQPSGHTPEDAARRAAVAASLAHQNAPATLASASPHNNAPATTAFGSPHSDSPHAAPPRTNSGSTPPATPAALITKSWNDPIDRYLARKPTLRTPSPLTGNGPIFELDGKQYTIDPRLIVGISGAETSFATGKCHSTPVSTTRNAWNWFYCYGSGSCGKDVCTNSPFDSWESGINIVSKYMQRNYVMKGLTDVRKIQTKYCISGCTYWVPNVEAIMKEMGGDPEHLTLTSQTH